MINMIRKRELQEAAEALVSARQKLGFVDHLDPLTLNINSCLSIKVKKLHPNAVIPSYANTGDAAQDLVAVSMVQTDDYIEYKHGLAFEIPEGYFGFIRPRSSVSKYDLAYSTSGVIDSGYRGEVSTRFKRLGPKIYTVGDRVSQLIILPCLPFSFVEADELSDSERGAGGHGSTGK